MASQRKNEMTGPVIDPVKAMEIFELVRQAKVLGITQEQLNQFGSDVQGLKQEIQKRRNLSELSWQDKNRTHAARRRKIAAAYLAGASLRQLAFLYDVLPETIAKLSAKELPPSLRLRIARERTARGRRRDPIWTPTQISAMIGGITEEEALNKAVAVTAATMQEIARGATEEDEDDPYLRDEAGAESSDTSEG